MNKLKSLAELKKLQSKVRSKIKLREDISNPGNQSFYVYLRHCIRSKGNHDFFYG